VHKVDASRPRNGAQSGVVPAAGMALISVTWDASPDLEQFMAFITAYTRGRFRNTLAERITLASTELLDNAVRYGSLARNFTYRLELEETRVTVCVENTTVRTRVEMLAAQLRRLEAEPDQVYASELERSMLAGGRRSMLGLARIRHEAEMRVELHVEGNEVCVRAHCSR
jgi:hypothetical protein